MSARVERQKNEDIYEETTWSPLTLRLTMQQERRSLYISKYILS